MCFLNTRISHCYYKNLVYFIFENFSPGGQAPLYLKIKFRPPLTEVLVAPLTYDISLNPISLNPCYISLNPSYILEPTIYPLNLCEL